MLLPSQMSREEFVATFGPVFEHAPWIAEQTYGPVCTGSLDELPALHEAMCRVLDSADPGSQRAIIRAHPDLAGKLAIEGDLTEASRGEQASAGLDRCAPEEFEELSRLNTVYTERFGFPFIMAVKGSNPAAILAALGERLGKAPETEVQAALREIKRIAYFRLEEIFAHDSE